MREEEKARPPAGDGDGLETLFEALRAECAAPPVVPGFLAGFRARRDARIERGVTDTAWRLLALRLAPAGGLAAAAALVLTVGMDSAPAPETDLSEPAVAEYEDPLAAGLEQAGVATVALSDEEAGYELLAVLYEPLGTR